MSPLVIKIYNEKYKYFVSNNLIEFVINCNPHVINQKKKKPYIIHYIDNN